jgi:glyoxylase-like metal-dependent hydrolase (beta-lactamase superfamily II)
VPDIVPGVDGLGNKLVNWYLVEDGGRLTAVDAGVPGFRARLEADLAALGHVPGDVEAVVLTHSDADHTGLAAPLHDAGARVLINSADDATLRKPGPKSGDGSPVNALRELWRPQLWRLIIGLGVRGGAARPTKFEGAETFEDGDVLDVPGSPRVIATPGHTAGHCAIYFEQHGVLFVGDEMCTWNPMTGKRGPQLMPRSFNVSTAQCLRSLDAIEGVNADVLLHGHGDPWRGGVSAAVEHARAAARH